jgi:hypothetical protein
MNTRFKVFASDNILQYLCDFIHGLIFVTVSKCRKSPKLTNRVIQVMIWVFLPDMISRGGATMQIMNYILMTFLFQYIPRVVHFVLFGWRLQRINGYIFGTATWGFVLNFAMYLCAAHVSISTLATMFSSKFLARTTENYHVK